jgi:hypothetical protein
MSLLDTIALIEAEEATQQQIFDEVWQWFVVEKHAASMQRLECAYRGSGDTKCAFGIFIRDEKYRQRFEGVGVHSLILSWSVPRSYRKHIDFFDDLRKCHDKSVPDGFMFHAKIKERLTLLAKALELTLPKGE